MRKVKIFLNLAFIDELKIVFYISEEILKENYKKLVKIDTLKLKFKTGDKPIYNCFRCNKEEINTICIDCRKAFYCSPKCLEKNKEIHSIMCGIYIKKNPHIDTLVKSIKENFDTRYQGN